VSSLIDQIRTLTTTRPTEQQINEPRVYTNRRKTWVPMAGEKVTVWRMASFDPDVQEAHQGVFVTSSETSWTVHVDGESYPEPFNKRDIHGGTNWFLASRNTHEMEFRNV
jgi:hypothetical protein